MKYLYLILLLFYFQYSFGQIENTIDSLIIFEIEEEELFRCDSIIEIEKHGNIECKLIYKQPSFNIKKKNFIMLPSSKVCKDDYSIIFSDDSRLSKTILQIKYDTCDISDFEKKDNEREYIQFVLLPDTAELKNWKVHIDCLGSHCMDTDYHFVRVSKNKSNYIDFTCLHNIRVFELDLNNDGLLEIYLISYIWCASEIRIYRIDEK